MKKALICGVGGQDGSYLAKLLLEKGYEVWGTSRDIQSTKFHNLNTLGIIEKIRTLSMAPNDFRSVLSVLTKSEPDEVYYLAGQSSVGLSFDQPIETIESITLGTLNLLEAVRFLGKPIRVYHASSSECFGDLNKIAATEQTSFRPRSPYAVAKASAHWLVVNYREGYGLYACNGILFNHESPLRPIRFVTQKIIHAATRIANGSSEKLKLGRLDIVRDWGWAPEYIKAMWLMLQQNEPDDYNIATGEAHSLEYFVEKTFMLHGLDWKKYVDVDKELYRPSDINWSCGDSTKAKKILGWSAETKLDEIISKMSNSLESE